MKVLALAFPGFTFIDLAGPMQAFMMLPGFSSQIVWHSKGIVDSDAGVSVQATEDFGSCWKDPDILFVPGNSIHLFKQLQDDRTIDFIADVGSRAKWITSVCNGSLLLGAAGLLKGYKAASYWYTREHLSLFGAIPTDARYVIDRNRATGGGMTAGIDFGLAMVGPMGSSRGRPSSCQRCGDASLVLVSMMRRVYLISADAIAPLATGGASVRASEEYSRSASSKVTSCNRSLSSFITTVPPGPNARKAREPISRRK